MANIEKVGVLLVHGVGEQRRFEHLASEIRHIVSALNAEPDIERVSVQVNSSRTAAYLAEQETLVAEEGAPVRISVRERGGKRLEIDVHEVWWADLDEPTTLWSQVRFWCWGLTLWSAKRFTQTTLPGSQQMMSPKFRQMDTQKRLLVRFQLFGVSTIFLLVLTSLSLLNFVLRRLRLGEFQSPEILVQYVGDVKLMQQRRRQEHGVLSDMNQPPRVAIRRRMVRALVDMALGDYPRWYIFAHSLGTVVAWNGLMETEHCLPNYLDEERWKKIQPSPLRKDINPAPYVGNMQPLRPVWLEDQDGIDRKALFAKLQGFVTYGSPLDKFAHLWPAIVPINKDETDRKQTAFPSNFEWINVYDQTDPVGGSLDAFHAAQPLASADQDKDPDAKLGEKETLIYPRNYAFSAKWVLLLSHIRYLSFLPKKRGRFVNLLAQWLVKGERFPEVSLGENGWLSQSQERARQVLRYGQWALVAVALPLLVALWSGELGETAGAMLGKQTDEVVCQICTPQTDAPGPAGEGPSDARNSSVSLLKTVFGTLERAWELIKRIVTWAAEGIDSIPKYFLGAAVFVFIAGIIGYIRELRVDQAAARQDKEEAL